MCQKRYIVFTETIKSYVKGKEQIEKEIFAISVVIVLIGTVFCYLQFGREIDVGSCFSMNSSNYKQERINVILNKLIVIDCKEEIADTIIKKTLDNDFHTIRFKDTLVQHPPSNYDNCMIVLQTPHI